MEINAEALRRAMGGPEFRDRVSQILGSPTNVNPPGQHPGQGSETSDEGIDVDEVYNLTFECLQGQSGQGQRAQMSSIGTGQRPAALTVSDLNLDT